MSEGTGQPTGLTVGATALVRVGAMANGGAAVARSGDLVLFVEGAMPGELVTVRITERRRTFARATVVTVDEASPDRVAPPCPYFGRCGGCQWQHMAYPAQLAAKREIVRDQFRRGLRLPDDTLDAMMRPPIGMDDPWHYRNVVSVEPDAAGKPSFHHLHSAQLVAVDHCPISQPGINAALHDLAADGIADETTIRVSADGTPLSFTARQMQTVRQTLLGVPFRVSGGAFFQVNTGAEQRPGFPMLAVSMADVLALHVLEGAALTGVETVLDLYAGVGTFAILASPHARRVVAVEDVPVAATDARFNATEAGAHNVEVHTRKAEQLLASFSERVNVAILDPPRAGCAPEVVEGLLRLMPQRIVYVSCDVATLVRDLRLFRDAYDVASCQIVDLFPQTFHIESVTVLTRRERGT